MAKVSIGLRGWRFEEEEIFDEDGEYRPLQEVPDDQAERLRRLYHLVEEPCDGCYLDYGEAEIHRCKQATIVYGEPLAEVLLCESHEADFLYWFREAGGADLRGQEGFDDAFHEWYADGGRAPDGYGGLEHVNADPDGLPDPPQPQEIQRRLNEEFDGRHIDVMETAGRDTPEESEDLDEEAVSDVLDSEYPSD
jgi:hypothetical protein